VLNSIAQTIKAYREQMKMSQEELAQKVRVGKNTIEKYESGEHIPSTQTLLKISTVLDIPASKLAIHHEIHEKVEMSEGNKTNG